MLSSIHPLGERTRNNRWWLTVSSFTAASTGAAALIGAGLGGIGQLSLSGVPVDILLLATSAVAVIAAILDVQRTKPPGPARQVNESWISHYRGWVYGGAFGAQLGTGIATYVVTWLVYATLVSEFLTASVTQGAIVGAIFGFGRSIVLLVARVIDRPSRLSVFHRRMADLGPSVHRMTSVGSGALAVAVIGASLL